MDRETGRSKGFGFVEMSSEDEAQTAIKQMNGKDIGGRPVTVSEARPQENRERRSFSDNGGNRY
jgi:RNA recognition motif-containing protein